MANKDNTAYVWKDRKRTLFGLPLSFTVFKLTEEKLYIETGLFSKKEEEVRLYRILDLTLKRSLGQRIFGLGTIHCCTADKSTPEFDIKSIKKSRDVKNMISDMVEAQREAKRVSSREFMDDDFDHDNFE
ncbi:MAG: PH domain-containing protein [Ruminococcaceae bacterium]|nr:PH domain-containing protein [Oscillospiraceae bacterium]